VTGTSLASLCSHAFAASASRKGLRILQAATEAVSLHLQKLIKSLFHVTKLLNRLSNGKANGASAAVAFCAAGDSKQSSALEIREPQAENSRSKPIFNTEVPILEQAASTMQAQSVGAPITGSQG
jgi:hypothetical protein